MKKNTAITITIVCTIIGLALGILGATLSYGQEAGILKQKVESNTAIIAELKDLARDSNKFQIALIKDISDIKTDVAVLTAIMSRIEEALSEQP